MSRRSFVGNLTKAGITMTAAQGVLASVSSVTVAQTGPVAAPAAGAAAAPATTGQAATAVVRVVQGTGGSAFADQLIASGENTYSAIPRARTRRSMTRWSTVRSSNTS